MQIIFDDKDLEESLDDTHYGNKKWKPGTFHGGPSRDDDQARTWGHKGARPLCVIKET